MILFKQLIWLLAFTSVFSVGCVCGSAGQTNCVVRRLEYFKLFQECTKVTFSLDVFGRHKALTLVHACSGGNGRVMSYLGSCMALVGPGIAAV